MRYVLLTLLCHFLISCSSTEVKEFTPPKIESKIVTLKEAYLYGYPLVTMEMAKRVLTNVKTPNKRGFAPINQFSHQSLLADRELEILDSNPDVLYSSAFLDLSKGPLILSVPHSKERYFSLQVINGWTDIIGTIGTRMNLDQERSYFIHGPGWRGIPPRHMKIIASNTHLNWILGRTYVQDQNDVKKAIRLMQNYSLRPMRSDSPQIVDPQYVNKTPSSLVEKLSGEEFFSLLNILMLKNYSSKEDRPQLERLAKIGVNPGMIFDVDNFTAEEQRYLNELPQVIAQEFIQKEKNAPLAQGWDMNLDSKIGKFGTNYELRAQMAFAHLGIPLLEDAIFPEAKFDSDREPLSGQYKYVLHFNKGQTPPSHAFWSLTSFAGETFSKLDSKRELLYNSDGSLDIYIQNEVPTGNKKQNWLPTPRGIFTIRSRIYWPESKMMNGQWTMPGITKNRELNMADSE